MTDEHAAGPADPAESDPAAEPRRRRHRRAYGGTPREPDGADSPAATTDAAAPAPAPRAPDDTDIGWGDRPDPDDDERFLREVPPHW